MQPGHDQSHQPPGEFNPFENLSSDLYRRDAPAQAQAQAQIQQAAFRDGECLYNCSHFCQAASCINDQEDVCNLKKRADFMIPPPKSAFEKVVQDLA